jgi:hypothetical protein
MKTMKIIKQNYNKINNEFKEKKIGKRYYSILGVPNQINDLQISKTFIHNKSMRNIIDDEIQNDKNLIKENPIKFEDIEFINQKCSICKKKTESNLYKDYKNKDKDIYICEICYRNINKKEHKNHYFEIKFPENVLKLKKERKIRRKVLGNKPINDFNNFLKKIFFDNEGNFSLKEINEINEKDFSELKRIYDDMMLIKENPVKYFAEYQVSYINKQKMNLDENGKKLIEKKLKLVLDNLTKLQK